MKKQQVIILMVLFAFLLVPDSLAIINSCTLNNPANLQYDNGLIKLNATAIWQNATGVPAGPGNVTNVTITVGSTIYSNSTVNGSVTNNTGGVTAGDFTFTVATAAADGAYTTYATCYNSTDATASNVALNSSTVTYTIDSKNPSVIITNPLSGSIVVPTSNNLITFEYKATDTNLGNCSLNLNNGLVTSSTSSTTSSNVTSGSTSRFNFPFPADNSSVRVAIGCRDLAGQQSSSSPQNNFTFSVLTGNSPTAIRMARQASGVSYNQQSFTAAGPSASAVPVPSSFQDYAWIYLLTAFLVVGIVFRRKIFK